MIGIHSQLFNMITKSIFALVSISVVSLVSCIPQESLEPPPRRYRPIRWVDSEPERADREMSEMTPEAPELEPEEPVERLERVERDEPEDVPRPARRAPAPGVKYPTATVTANPDQVLSPYKPYSVIDISGPPRFKSGQLARDPVNRKIFKIP